MQVLHDQALASEILSLLDEPESRCAVAFWGPAMAKRAVEAKATVILDVLMGCTSKLVLNTFGVRRRRVPKRVAERVRVLDGLHAKIFLGRDRAIVASANASANALGRTGRAPVLREAGVLVTLADDPDAFRQAEAVWAAYLAASRGVRSEDLDRAASRPATLAAGDWSSQDAGNAHSILGTLLRNADAFLDTAFAFGDSDISEPDRRTGEQAYADEMGTQPAADRRKLIAMFDRRDDPDADDRFRTATSIIVFWFGRDADLYAYHDIVRVEHDKHYVTFFGRRSWSTVRRMVGMPSVTKDQAWSADDHDAEALSKLHGGKKGNRYVALSADEAYDHAEALTITD